MNFNQVTCQYYGVNNNSIETYKISSDQDIRDIIQQFSQNQQLDYSSTIPDENGDSYLVWGEVVFSSDTSNQFNKLADNFLIKIDPIYKNCNTGNFLVTKIDKNGNYINL